MNIDRYVGVCIFLMLVGCLVLAYFEIDKPEDKSKYDCSYPMTPLVTLGPEYTAIALTPICEKRKEKDGTSK
jgi:hypothetical protein